MPEPSSRPPQVVQGTEDLRAVVAEAARAQRVAVDVEASGMFTYAARPCTAQLAWDEGARIVVVDALATSLGPLAALLGATGPIKIVHDVAFDARLLAEADLPLARVHDTSVAARMLGRTATGLASLLGSELGVVIEKGMQQHDWRIRPIDERMLGYLAEDVAHVEALERVLWSALGQADGAEEATLVETEYRIACAVEAVRAPRTPHERIYMHVKGADRLNERELAALRAVAALREAEAERRDVPPYRVAPNEALIAAARARPGTAEAVARVRGMPAQSHGHAFLGAVARALATAGDRLPEDERGWRDHPAPPTSVLRERRERERRLLDWRRAEAKRRAVDEQVILPGHCVRDAVQADVTSIEALTEIAGIGAFRVRRDGEAIVAALTRSEASA